MIEINFTKPSNPRCESEPQSLKISSDPSLRNLLTLAMLTTKYTHRD